MVNWYSIGNAEEIDTPALLVYPKRIKANIELAINMIGDVNRLRPHVKTHKCDEIAKIQIQLGVNKFKCATIAEAEMLGRVGAKDVLLAYPIQGPKVKRFLDLIKKYPNTLFATVVDNIISASFISNEAFHSNLVVNIYVDLNLGMGRTGISPNHDALNLYFQLLNLSGIKVCGLHGYDGHVREINLEKRKIECDSNYEGVQFLLDKLKNSGVDDVKVVIGGSPSFPIYSQYPNIECSPGTFVFWDKGYGDQLPEQSFLTAAILLCRVVSKPTLDTICVDLGYKAVASENPIQHRFSFLNSSPLQIVGQSEEHLVLQPKEPNLFNIGDVLYAIPYHICPTVALYDQLNVVENSLVTSLWKVTSRIR